MKAMIFAAGLGTRLRPLTLTMPKALVEVQGRTLLEITLKKLITSGFDEIIINIHHLGEQIIEFLKRKNNFDIRIEISDERDELLDTGGGLKKASWFFDDGKPFLAHNVDVLSGINLKDLYEKHVCLNPLATLAVKKRLSSRYLLFNNEDQLCAWKNIKSGELIQSKPGYNPLRELAFSGIQVISPHLFDLCSQKGSFSIISTYLHLAKNYSILCYEHSNDDFMDVGKISNLEESQFLNIH